VRNLTITKASPTIPAIPIESLTITVEGEPPDMAPAEAASFYHKEAALLAVALWATLPSGTMDQLIGILLQCRASLFRIPFAQPEKEETHAN